MKIKFANQEIEALCSEYEPGVNESALEKYVAKKSKGERTAAEVMRGIAILKASKNPSEIPPWYNYHLLKYDRSGQGSIDVYSRGKGKKGGRGNWRTVFEPKSNCDNINKESSIEEIKIIDLIKDYHD